MRTKQHCPDCRFSVRPVYERLNGKFRPIKKALPEKDEHGDPTYGRDIYHLHAYYCDHCKKLVWLREYGRYYGL